MSPTTTPLNKGKSFDQSSSCFIFAAVTEILKWRGGSFAKLASPIVASPTVQYRPSFRELNLGCPVCETDSANQASQGGINSKRKSAGSDAGGPGLTAGVLGHFFQRRHDRHHHLLVRPRHGIIDSSISVWSFHPTQHHSIWGSLRYH